MINNLILVGRVADNPDFKNLDNGLKVCNLTLAVGRPFKDMTTGEYGTDFIKISLWSGIAQATYNYCNKGDIIGVKGRIADRVKEVDGINNHYLEVIGERVVFIYLKKAKSPLSEKDSAVEK
ncbi:MAG: single-stranded DNA-binding protein [Bacilli bacterium]